MPFVAIVRVWVCAGGARKGERKWVGGQMKEWEEMKVRESNKFLNADLFDLAGLSGCGHSAELPQGFKGYYSSQCQYTCQGIVVNVVCCLPGRTTILILYGSYRQVTSRQLATMVIDPLYRDIDYRAIIPEQ